MHAKYIGMLLKRDKTAKRLDVGQSSSSKTLTRVKTPLSASLKLDPGDISEWICCAFVIRLPHTHHTHTHTQCLAKLCNQPHWVGRAQLPGCSLTSPPWESTRLCGNQAKGVGVGGCLLRVTSWGRSPTSLFTLCFTLTRPGSLWSINNNLSYKLLKWTRTNNSNSECQSDLKQQCTFSGSANITQRKHSVKTSPEQ